MDEIRLPTGDVASLGGPRDATGLVLTGDRSLAPALHGHGLATLALELPDEGVDLLAERLVAATDHVRTLRSLPIGYLAAGAGAAAALIAASQRPGSVRAVVSHAGRPDLAGWTVALVRAPTLLIVGRGDPHLLELNRIAARRMTAPTEVAVADEPMPLTAAWFARYLGAPLAALGLTA